jgi:hypothetical protein
MNSFVWAGFIYFLGLDELESTSAAKQARLKVGWLRIFLTRDNFKPNENKNFFF